MIEYERALMFAIQAHSDQKRKYTGEPYVLHSIRVASMVTTAERYIHTYEMVEAALLHDVIEDAGILHEQLDAEFGPTVARLIDEITNISTPADGNRVARKAVDLKHLARASREAQTIKVCDIIDNASSVRLHDPTFAAIYLPEKRAQLDVLTLADPRLRDRAYQIVNEFPAARQAK